MNHGNQGGKNGNSRKERPVRTYCGLVDHVADKCYKLHGYPSCYKHKRKASANQVSSNDTFGSLFCNNGGFGNFLSQPMQGFANQTDLMHCSPQHPRAQFQAQPLFNTPQCHIT